MEIVRGGWLLLEEEEEEGAAVGGADIPVDCVTVEMVGNESRFRLRLGKRGGLDGGVGRCNDDDDWSDDVRCNSDRWDDIRGNCGNHCCNGDRYGADRCNAGGRRSDGAGRRRDDAGHCSAARRGNDAAGH